MRRALRVLRFLMLALLLLPTLAFADQGVALKLSWDHCAGDGYVGDRSFACDTNTGSETLWLSMVITDGIERANVAAFTALVDFRLTSSTMPSWWVTGTGTCRGNAITLLAGAPAASGSCEPWFSSSGVEPLGVAQMSYGDEGPNMTRLNFGAALQEGSEVTLAPGIEYLLARIQISHAKSAGTGACTGCLVPACIGFGKLDLQYPSPTPTESFAGSLASAVTWQRGYVSNFTPTLPYWAGSGYYPYYANLQCSTGPVPARSQTWGTIKTMYR